MKPLFPPPPPPPPMARDPERAVLVRKPLHERLLTTLRYLTEEVEVRRPGSLGEAQAAGYIAGQLNRADQQATVVSITTGSGTRPGLATLLLLAAIVSVAAAFQRIPGAMFALLVFALLVPLLWIEIDGGSALGALFGRRQSQNVVGVRAPVGTGRRVRVVLTAPLDFLPYAPPRQLLLFALQLIGIQAALIAAWWWTGQEVLRWCVAAGCLALLGVMLALLVLRWRGRVRPAILGAGDLSVLVAVAEELGELQQVELWTVALGAVSLGDSGITHLLERYPFEPTTLFVNLHRLTGGQPAYVTREGVLREHRSDRRLLALASSADAADVTINAEPRQLRQRTVAAIPLRRGYPTITLTSYADQPGLTSTDPATLARCVQLVVGMIRKLDRTM